MNELSQFLIESILTEAASIDKTIVVYSGRFQPFHKGHYATYDNLIHKFGKDNVYIGTSDVTDNKKSPFNFKEKKAIMTTMFGIPSNKIVNVRNPYAPEEILGKFNSDTTGFITVVGEKDEQRLGGKYFTPYKGKVTEPYLERGYVYAAPAQPNAISGTDVRYWLSAGSEEERKKNFTKAYPRFDSQIFKLITLKLKKLKECINEEIKLNVKVGDTLLMGKFKNKKVIVKSIGEDEYGMPTINGKKAVTFRIPKKENIKETVGNDSFDGSAGEPSTSHLNAGDKRILNKHKPEFWFKNGGYTQLHIPEADWVQGKNAADKEDGMMLRQVTYNVSNVVDTNLDPAKDPHTVEDWQEVQPKKPIKKAKRFWEDMEANDKLGLISEEDINQIIEDILSEMGFPGGVGVGLSLPSGYINGAPDSKDVKKNSKKLNNNGMSGYEEVDEIAVQADRIPGGLAKGKTLIDLAKKWDVKEYYDPKQFAKEYIKPRLVAGIKVEMEHTTDVSIAAEIAMDHLWEDLHYYEKLSKIENESLLEYTATETAGFNDGNTVTGTQWNSDWEDYDTAGYYTKDLPGWNTIHEKPSEHELKRLKNQAKLPVDNHDDSVHKYNRTLKYGYKLPFDFIKGDGKSTAGTTDEYPNQYDNQPGTDERINMDPTIDIDGKAIKDDERHIAKSVKLRNPVNESSLKDLEKQRMVLFIKALKMMPQSPAQMKVRAEIDKLNKEIQKLQKENINEGGAYGHMNHPFDIEMNLTFGDLKQIVVRALNGDLELAREKTDGQALAVSWVNGRLVAARNKSHLKNKGEGAMTIGQVADKFAGRGGLTDAYNYAMKDLSAAIAALSEEQRKKIFKDGSCFMNLEVIYPTSVNVIPYNQPLLVFHGTFEYDTDGTIVGENQQAAKILAGMIKQVNQHVQSQYTIQGPPMQSLPKSEDLSKKQGKYISMINKLQKEFNLSDSDGVADYHQAWWSDFVNKGAKKLDAQQKIGLIKRWAFGDKSFRIAEIQDDKIRGWAEQTDKKDQQKISKDNLMKFEEIFLGVGADVLAFTESVLTANPSSARKQMVARLESTISQVKASGDPKKIAKLKLELERLKALGGFDKIVPNEGIVFVYSGNTYKLTGAFAPLNQILGIFFDK
jgi:hypothetical protein